MTSWATTLAVVLVACQLTLVASVISQRDSHPGAGTGPECSLAPTADVSWTQSDVSLNSILLHHLGDRTFLQAHSATDDDVIDGSAQYQAALGAVSDWRPLGDNVEISVGNVHAWHPESIIHNQIIPADPQPEADQIVLEQSPSCEYLPRHCPDLLSSDRVICYGVPSAVDGKTSNGNVLSSPISVPLLPSARADEKFPSPFNSNECPPTDVHFSVDPWYGEHGLWSTSPPGDVDVSSIGNDVPGVSSVLSDMDLPTFIDSEWHFPLPSAHAYEQVPSPFNSNELCPPTDVHLSVHPWHGEHGVWSTSPAGNVVSSIGNDVPGVSSVLSGIDLLSFINSEGHFPNAFHSPIGSIQIGLQSHQVIPPDTALSTWPAYAIGDTPIDTHSIDTSRIASRSPAVARISDDADCCPLSSLVLQGSHSGHWTETAPSNVVSAADCIVLQSMQCLQNQVAADQNAWNMFLPAELNPAQIREGDYGTLKGISEPPSLQSLPASSHDRCTAVPIPPEPVRAQGTTEESVSMSGLQLQQGLPKPHGSRPQRPREKCEHGRRHDNCKICSPHYFCEPHGRRKYGCTICGGSGTCVHGRVTYKCGDCGGKGICPHARQRQHCRECRGSSICKHDKYKYHCKACGGKRICVHQQQKGRCGECRRAAELAMA